MTDGSDARAEGAIAGGGRSPPRFAASDAHLSLVMDAARMVAWEWNPITNAVAAAGGDFASVIGIPHLTAAQATALVHPDDTASHDDTVRHAMETGERYRCEFRIVRPDNGRVMWVEERGIPVRDEGGTLQKLVGVTMDVTERKAAEAERARLLAEAERARAEAEAERTRLREILALSPATIAVSEGPEHVTTFANQAYLDTAGGRDVIGVPVREAFPHVDPERYAILDQVYRTGTPRSGTEIPIRSVRDGEAHEEYFDIAYVPVRDAAGAVNGVLRFAVNVSARVRARQRAEALAAESARILAAEQAARAEADAARARLVAVVEQMPAAVIIAAVPSGRLVLGNPQVAQITGHPMRYSDDIAAYTADWSGFHEDGTPLRAEEWPLARAIATGEIVTGAEVRYRRGDGTDTWIRLNAAPIRDGSGEIVAGVVMFTDVSDRREAGAKLREGEARLRHALDAGAMGAWSWDIATNTVTWSEQIEPMHGLAPGTFGGTHAAFLDLVHPDDREVVGTAIATALRERDDYVVAFRAVWADGTTRRMEGRGRILRGEGGAATGIAGLVMDVTERWEAEAERDRLLDAERAARAEAEAAVRARDTFLSIAAHELKTPVTALKGNAQLLLRQQDRGTLAPERLTRALRGMDRSADRLATLTNDLLDVSRIRTGQLPLAPEPTDLLALVREAVERMEEASGERHRFVCHFPETLPPVSLDPARVEQVLANILSNAAKYSPDGGAITASVWEDDGGVAVRVRDEGIGLPPGASAVIFQPFGRAANALAHNFPGMGLGLYISRTIVERHGGRMWAESAGEGRGAAVTFWLPFRADDAREDGTDG